MPVEHVHDFTHGSSLAATAGYEPGDDGSWRKSETPEGDQRRQAMDLDARLVDPEDVKKLR
jgi:hypothetical protein